MPINKAPYGSAVGESVRIALTDGEKVYNSKLKLSDYGVNVKQFGAKGDGVTDDTTAIQAAIDEYASATTKTIIRGNGNFKTSGLSLKSGIYLELDKVTFSGTAGNSLFETPADSVLINAGVSARIDMADAGFLLESHSMYGCEFSFPEIDGTRTTSTVISLKSDSSAGSGPTGTKNTAKNIFRQLIHHGDCGKLVVLNGTSGVPVTLNTFEHFTGHNVYDVGYDFIGWCDSNAFIGIHRVSLRANNAEGVIFNSGDAANVAGVYSNVFQHLAVDTFNTFTGRVGARVNNSRYCQILSLHNDPVGEGGAVIIHDNAKSYMLRLDRPGTDDVYMYTRNFISANGAFEFKGNSGQSISSTSNVTITYSTEQYDTGADADETTGKFTAPEDGLYYFQAVLSVDATTTVGDVFLISILQNTTEYASVRFPVHTVKLDSVQISSAIVLVKADTVSIAVRRASGSGNFPITASNGAIVKFQGRFIE